MPTYIALLRAVNLGPNNKIGKADLEELVAGLGMLEVRTLLNSGNVVFRTGERATPDTLEQRIEQAAAARLGLETDVFVRSAKEWSEIVGANPFQREAGADPSHLVVVPLKTAPDRAAVASLQKSITGRESVKAVGRCAYVVYPDGIGNSKLTSARLEKGLGSRGTARNWNTVLKLAALAGR